MIARVLLELWDTTAFSEILPTRAVTRARTVTRIARGRGANRRTRAQGRAKAGEGDSGERGGVRRVATIVQIGVRDGQS